MPSRNDKISIIIPTVNAVEELDLAITSIKKNSDHPHEFLIVVDPDMNTGKTNQDILAVCKKHKIKPIINKTNLGPYGNWNKGANNATTDWFIFATDDQYFAPHWDSVLLDAWKPKRLVSGRLIEPGIIPVYKTNIQKDFGVLPSEFQETEFIKWCASRQEKGFEKDGFFIPMLQNKEDYNTLGGYPTKGKFGTSSAVSNDVIYVQEALKKGYEFGTARASYSYHFQASSWKKKTLKPKIAAVVLTYNSEQYLAKTLSSLNWVQDIVILDSGSTDKTLAIAKKYKAKIYSRNLDNFATQRNFALTKVASYDWVIMVDSDEEVEKQLREELMSFAKDIYLDGVEIPRKNFIFGRWIKHTDWYPDRRLIFFRPKIIQFKHGIHERARFIKGNETTAQAKGHIIHYNYDTVAQFIQKNLLTYPQAYAKHLDSKGYRFKALDLIQRPVAEFMRRFFLTEGYRDGLYGLVLSILMAAQSSASYAYLWELQGKRKDLTTEETQELFKHVKGQGRELSYWLLTMTIETSKGTKKMLTRAKRKLHKYLKSFK